MDSVHSSLSSPTGKSRTIFNEKETLEYVMTGLQKGIAAIQEPKLILKAGCFSEFSGKLIDAMANRDGDMIEVFVDNLWISLKEKQGSTYISVDNSGWHRLTTTPLNRLQEKLISDIIDQPRYYSTQTISAATSLSTSLNKIQPNPVHDVLSQPHLHSTDRINDTLNQALITYQDLPSAVLAAKYICDNCHNPHPISTELISTAANHMFQYAGEYSNSYLLNMAELVLADIKLPESPSLADRAKHVLAIQTYDATSAWSAVIYGCYAGDVDSDLFKTAVDLLVQNTKNAPTGVAAQAAFRFIEYNQDFFTAPFKKEREFIRFFNSLGRADILASYSSQLSKALHADTTLYTIRVQQGKSEEFNEEEKTILDLWCPDNFGLALSANTGSADKDNVSVFILTNMEDPALTKWNSRSETSATTPRNNFRDPLAS